MPYTEVINPCKPLMKDSATSDQINRYCDQVRRGKNPCHLKDFSSRLRTSLKPKSGPEILSSFHQKVPRRVNPDFSDVQLNKMFFKVDPKLRGDKVEVRYDPFSQLNTIEVYSLNGGV